jgi:hypothetical protein
MKDSYSLSKHLWVYYICDLETGVRENILRGM